MSSFRGDRSRGSRSRYGDRDDRHQSGSRSDNPRSSRGGRSRGRGHPSGLRGKEIGLYYRDKARKNAEPERNYFSLDPVVEDTVVALLQKFRTRPEEVDLPEPPRTSNPYTHIRDSHFKRKFLDIVSGSIQQNLSKALLMTSKLSKNSQKDAELQTEQRTREQSGNFQKMLEFRKKLPSYKMKNEVLDLIRSNQVIVISGETGCGKTTQVAQFILDDEISQGHGSTTKIICTQPRRISAISVAERVAAERAEPLGNSVGYQIRLEKIMCRDYGSILFCTTGLLLQFMQGDPALRDYSHIILDEIHERNTESDFIITLLKQVVPKRPDLKVILMSATLNSERFSSYFDGCPNVHIPGFTFPVMEFYLEDILKATRFQFPVQKFPENYKKHFKKFREMKGNFESFEEFMEPVMKRMREEGEYPEYVLKELRNPNSEVLSLELVVEVLEFICGTKGPGAVLVFLPGMMDISNLMKMIMSSGKFPGGRFCVYPLHSRLPTSEQRAIFKKPGEGVRKIIVSTSIAETSITIEDVVYVVDCGKTKLTRFDIARNIETLAPEWIAAANAKQRRGRAGRVQPGEVYKLYTRAREMAFDQYPTPEMLRTPLEQVILQAKILQLGRVEVFLGSVMDPPEDRAIQLALDLLRMLNALDNNEQLTPLGYHLAKLPLDPRTGKMVLWASMFSCVAPVFAIAASLSFKDAFYCPLGKETEANAAKLSLGLGLFSDHIALAEALKQYEKSLRFHNSSRFCSDHFLSRNTLKLLVDMKHQFAKHLHEMKFLESEDPSHPQSNRNSHNYSMIKAIVCAGLFPNIATVKPGKFPKLRTNEDGTVKIHPGSINARVPQLPTKYLTYFLKKKSTAIYLHDTTSVNEAALIFAAPKSSVRREGKRFKIVLNEELEFLCNEATARIIQRLREGLDGLLEEKITEPGSGGDENVVRAIIEVVTDAESMVHTNY